MLTALVLSCSAAVDPHDCPRSNANTALRLPAEFGNPATCFMHAQAYRAGNSIGRLGANERVRVLCMRNEILAASTWGQ